MNIEQLAKEAGMNTSMWNYGAGSMAFTMGVEGVARGAIERFAALVIEECAKVCDVTWEGPHKTAADRLAASIRALKEQP